MGAIIAQIMPEVGTQSAFSAIEYPYSEIYLFSKVRV